MPNNPKISPTVKRAKCGLPPSSLACTKIFNRTLFRCKSSKTLSPPNIDRYQSRFWGNSIIVDQKVPSKRLPFDSTILMINTSRNLKKTDRFIVNPSSSDSLVQEARLSLSTSTFKVGNNTVEYIYSSKPQDDFYKSILEVVESRLGHNLTVDHDYIEELLKFYLEYNEESLHEHIYNAYLHVMVVLNKTSGKMPMIIPTDGNEEEDRN